MDRRLILGSLQKPMVKLGFLHVLNDGFLASLPLLLPFMQRDLGLGFESIGLLSSILACAGVVLALPSARLARKFGGFSVLGTALLLYSVAFIFAGCAAGLFSLTVSFALASIGFGLFIRSLSRWSRMAVRRRTSATGWGTSPRSATSAGSALRRRRPGWPLRWSWRETAIIYGVSSLMFPLLFRHRPDPVKVAAQAGAKPHGLCRSENFILAVVAGSLDALASSSVFIFIPFSFCSSIAAFRRRCWGLWPALFLSAICWARCWSARWSIDWGLQRLCCLRSCHGRPAVLFERRDFDGVDRAARSCLAQ